MQRNILFITNYKNKRNSIRYVYSMKKEKLRVQKSFMLLPIYTRGTTANNTHEFYDYIYYGSDAMLITLLKNATYFFGGIIADISNCHLSVLRRPLTERAKRYDHGARQYDCTAPRFTTHDPLEEKY